MVLIQFNPLKSIRIFLTVIFVTVVFSFAGQMTDPRDGQIYRTIKMGGQVWMAENLRFKVDNSYCYEDDDCSTYGRYYRWNDAKKICPAGWHLPVKGEMDALLKAGPKALQNADGFALLQAGSFGGQDEIVYTADQAFLWSATSIEKCGDNDDGYIDCSPTYVLRISHFGVSVVEEYFDADIYYSVRCVKD